LTKNVRDKTQNQGIVIRACYSTTKRRPLFRGAIEYPQGSHQYHFRSRQVTAVPSQANTFGQSLVFQVEVDAAVRSAHRVQLYHCGIIGKLSIDNFETFVFEASKWQQWFQKNKGTYVCKRHGIDTNDERTFNRHTIQTRPQRIDGVEIQSCFTSREVRMALYLIQDLTQPLHLVKQHVPLLHHDFTLHRLQRRSHSLNDPVHAVN
jgi:hypothetical protein